MRRSHNAKAVTTIFLPFGEFVIPEVVSAKSIYVGPQDVVFTLT